MELGVRHLGDKLRDPVGDLLPFLSRRVDADLDRLDGDDHFGRVLLRRRLDRVQESCRDLGLVARDPLVRDAHEDGSERGRGEGLEGGRRGRRHLVDLSVPGEAGEQPVGGGHAQIVADVLGREQARPFERPRGVALFEIGAVDGVEAGPRDLRIRAERVQVLRLGLVELPGEQEVADHRAEEGFAEILERRVAQRRGEACVRLVRLAGHQQAVHLAEQIVENRVVDRDFGRNRLGFGRRLRLLRRAVAGTSRREEEHRARACKTCEKHA